jgi:glycosyltransferase involved in cell wall biosynthesis
MGLRIYYDGLNLALQRGTGIATYTRILMNEARDLGHSVSAVYSVPTPPAKNTALREISFYDPCHAELSRLLERWIDVRDQLRSFFGIEPVRVEQTGIVITDNFRRSMPTHDNIFAARHLFGRARWHFLKTRRFVNLKFDPQPDIFHCTYQMPLLCKSACNVYTIHDLVPLRLPFATRDNKRLAYRLLQGVAAKADHIVTVSENSKNDIMKYLGVEENRITNTYQSVEFPREYVERSTDVVAEELQGSFGLEYGKYLLFYGALEPKKNVGRLIDAYLSSGVNLPLVLVTSGGWGNEDEVASIERRREQERAGRGIRRRIYRLDYVSLLMLVTIIRGACALIFPSLYEGFGLPVLEAMLLGTPVVTSGVSSLPEVAGDAALLVNPYEVDEIARAIGKIVEDADLRSELSARGRTQAAVFSVERYRGRVAQLYERFGTFPVAPDQNVTPLPIKGLGRNNRID